VASGKGNKLLNHFPENVHKKKKGHFGEMHIFHEGRHFGEGLVWDPSPIVRVRHWIRPVLHPSPHPSHG